MERESPTRTGGRTRRGSMPQPPDMSELRLVIVGKTGAGKSSSGNTILGSGDFRAAAGLSSVTRQCCKKKGEVLGREVSVTDTPGLFDTSLPEDTVEREIGKCINMSAPGPHAILLVIKAGPFTAEERDAVQKVEEIFGGGAWKYTIILFTHGDQIGSDIGRLLEESRPELQSVLGKVENRYHVFNNLKMNDRGQVLDLLDKVDNMVAANGGQCYSNYTYREVVGMLDQREAELRRLFSQKLEEEIKSVESKYEEKLREALQERREVEGRLQRELEELRRYYRALESGVRHVVEQTVKTDSIAEILDKFHETQKLKLTS